jgi:hypothetical protein
LKQGEIDLSSMTVIMRAPYVSIPQVQHINKHLQKTAYQHKQSHKQE